MLDVAPTELLLVAAVAVIVIGPKDLPRAMRFAGHWVGKARGVARQFRQGFDDMVREAEFKDMEKKWAEDNARIMREFPGAAPPDPLPPAPILPAPVAAAEDAPPAMTVAPALTDSSAEQPELFADEAKPAPRKRAPRKPAARKPKPDAPDPSA